MTCRWCNGSTTVKYLILATQLLFISCTEIQPAGYQTSVDLWPGSHQTNQTVTIRGQGTGLVGLIDIAGGAGMMELDGIPADVIVHARQPWQGRTLYQAVAVQEGRLWLLWFYCIDGRLTDIYREDTYGTPLAYEDASGSCQSSPDMQRDVTLKNATADILAAPVPKAVNTQEYQITEDGLGSYGDKNVYVFRVVSCPSHVCGNEWLEYHSVIVGETEVCTGIFYVFPNGRTDWAYPFCWASKTAAHLSSSSL